MTDPQIKEIRDHVRRIDQSLRGNGSSGLFTEFAVIKERVTTIERFVVQIEGLRRWVLMGIFGLFASVAWQAFEFYITQR